MMFDLPESEREQLSARFDALESSFAALEKVDVRNTEPLVTVLELSNILRGDVSGRLVSRDELMSNAPEQYDGFFKVPGTL